MLPVSKIVGEICPVQVSGLGHFWEVHIIQAAYVSLGPL